MTLVNDFYQLRLKPSPAKLNKTEIDIPNESEYFREVQPNYPLKSRRAEHWTRQRCREQDDHGCEKTSDERLQKIAGWGKLTQLRSGKRSSSYQEDPPAGVSGAPTENNIMLWNAVIFGPHETPFEVGEE